MSSAAETAADLGVWAELIGQTAVVATLRRAVAGEPHAMSHAWLFTGPPGSGRSNAARAFAAALQCDSGGCGHCRACRTSLSGAHPDVTLVRTELLSIGVDEVRELVRRAVDESDSGPVAGDRDRGCRSGHRTRRRRLLKSIEEPAPRTVWILCAPTADDVVATIRSRCRLLDAADSDDFGGRATARDPRRHRTGAGGVRGTGFAGTRRSGSGVGARRRCPESAATDPAASRSSCMVSARVWRRQPRSSRRRQPRRRRRPVSWTRKERTALEEALGFGTKGARPRQAQAALKDLEDQQRARSQAISAGRDRSHADRADRLLPRRAEYPDRIWGAGLINEDLRPQIAVLARKSTPESTLHRIDALLACRTALEGNVAPLLAVEAALIGLVEG